MASVLSGAQQVLARKPSVSFNERNVEHRHAGGAERCSGRACLLDSRYTAPGGLRTAVGNLRHSFSEMHAATKKPYRLQVRAAKEMTGSILRGEGLRLAVVAARFNEIVTRPLVAGALETFKTYAVKDDDVVVIWVPGSFEIPLVSQQLAKSGKFDAVLAIGAVIRGATTHYDAVAGSAASGLLSASLNSGVPVIFGVLTTENMEQAVDRAGGKLGNKGAEAALTTFWTNPWEPGPDWTDNLRIVTSRAPPSLAKHLR